MLTSPTSPIARLPKPSSRTRYNETPLSRPKIPSAVKLGWTDWRRAAAKRRMPTAQKTNHFPTSARYPPCARRQSASIKIDAIGRTAVRRTTTETWISATASDRRSQRRISPLRGHASDPQATCGAPGQDPRSGYASAVVGSIIRLTCEMRFAGNPPCFACSRTIASLGAM